VQKKKFPFLRKLYLALILIFSNLFFGMVGFMMVEGYDLNDAFYTTIIILSTVGLGVVHQLSPEGRIFVSIFVVTSISIFAYALSVVTSYIMEGDLQRYLKFRKVQKKIDTLNGHVIVCGYGRNGRQACEQLRAHNQPFVCIETNDKLIAELREDEKILFVDGDATKDEILVEAGIGKASALITTLPNDAANVFVVLTARELNPSLKIISRASEDSSEGKLRRAGADNVIMPDKIGGTHMATLVTRPDVLEFLDHITGKINIRLEEILCSKLNDHHHYKTIRELEIRNRTGANLIGFKTADGEYIINPDPDTDLQPDAKLFVLGTQDQVQKLLDILSS
jgi:voltage-gated potassium channel